MNPTLRKILDEINALKSDLQGIMSGEMTAEALAKGREIKSKIEALTKQANEIAELEKSLADANGLSASMPVPVELANKNHNFAGVTLEGTAPAGTTVIDTQPVGRDAKSIVIENFGEGMVTQAQAMATITDTYKSAFRKYLAKGHRGLEPADLKALTEGLDTGGGYLVPMDYVAQLIQKKPAPTLVAGRVNLMNTSRDALTMPKVNWGTDDIWTNGIRIVKTGEVPASSTAHRVTEPQFGSVTIPVNTFMMSMPVSKDFIEDSAIDVMSWASGKFGEAVNLFTDSQVLVGTGTGECTGMMFAPDSTIGGQAQITSVSVGNPYTADGLLGLVWDVPEQYEENLIWILRKTTSGKTIARLKDGSNRPIWSMGLNDSGITGGPHPRQGSLIGYPYIFSPFMPDMGANAFPLFFGDPQAFTLVRRIGFSIQVLTEQYAEQNQVVLLGRYRIGGQTTEPWRARAGKQA